MTMLTIARPQAASFLLALLSLMLASCFLAPGKFTSTLDIRKDGRFSFAYAGEIRVMALSKLSGALDEAKQSFTPGPCHKDDRFDERPCTAAEIAEQRRAWQEERRATDEKRRQDADAMKAILGGIDPSNPRAAEELAQRLRRQAGWNRAVYKGDGLYEVEFAIAGRLDHDFTFPTIERFPMANAFVQIARRSDGTVRVDAPGFAPGSGGEPYRGVMQGFAAKQGATPVPEVDGRFTVRSDGAILANNTDEGPQPDAGGQRLDWAVNARTPAAPTALIRLAP
jgi:hypothetical protein